jgi:DNA-binding PucR family transcriptional regulator
LSHREGLLARRVTQLRGESAARVSFPDVSLEALILNELDAARRFAARELGLLAAEDDPTLRLASTLAIFLDEGASFARAARRLGVHTYPVTYRVRRAEELLGHTASERQLELRTALRISSLGS